jgi:hypothetical protein
MTTLKMSKAEWETIGKTAGWMGKTAKHTDAIMNIWLPYNLKIRNETNKLEDDEAFLSALTKEASYSFGLGESAFDVQAHVTIESILKKWSRGELTDTTQVAKQINKIIGTTQYGAGEAAPVVTEIAPHHSLTDLRERRDKGVLGIPTIRPAPQPEYAVAGSKATSKKA